MKPCSIPNESCSTFAIGATQFVVHDAFETMWCADGSYASSLTPRTSVMSGSVAGAEITTFFAPAVEMLLCPFAVGEEPGRLEHDVDAQLAPWKRGRVALGQHLDVDVAGADRAVTDLDLLPERPERRVVAQQMRHGLRVAEVVRRDDLEVAAALQMRTEEVAADPAESVDAHPYLRHGFPPFSPVWPRV